MPHAPEPAPEALPLAWVRLGSRPARAVLGPPGLPGLPGLLGALLGALLPACAGEAPPPPSAPPAPPPRPTVRFVDVTAASGLGAFRHVAGTPERLTILEAFGAGVALFDVEGDGDLDVYLTNAEAGLPGLGAEATPASPDAPPRDTLFLNDGTGRFTDGTTHAGLGDPGWTTGVEVADVDGDGRLDLFLTGFGAQHLLVQRAPGAFTDVTAEAGLTSTRWSTGACFLDHDRDGDLDLYVANHIDLDLAGLVAERRRGEWQGEEVYFGPHGLAAAVDRFYRNQGDGTFVDVTAEVGLDSLARYGFEAVAFDADGDGWTDVYVANDGQPNTLWRNAQGLRFEEVGDLAGVALDAHGAALAGMGVAVGDVNGDGLPDLFVTNFSDEPSTLYVAREGGGYEDRTEVARLAAPTRPFLAWSTGFDDLDLDGDLDLWCVNGHVFPAADRVADGQGYRQPSQVFLCDGAGAFALARDLGRGLDVRAAGRGGAAGDLDGDGDLDLVLGNLDGPPTVLRNDTERRGRAVILRLVDRRPNTTAHGAVVTALAGTRRLARFVGTGAGFLSCAGPEVHLGLGDAPRLEHVTVRWADGSVDTYGGVEAGFSVVLERDHGVTRRVPLGRAR